MRPWCTTCGFRFPCACPAADDPLVAPCSSEPSPEPRGWSPSSDRLYASDGAGAVPHSASDFDFAPIRSRPRLRYGYGDSPLLAIAPLLRWLQAIEDIGRGSL